MEKIFSPNRWFVLFCGLLIVVWALLQFVGSMRLSQAAQEVGAEVFTWNWPEKHLVSEATITDTKIIKKTDNDAVVAVKARQTLRSDAGTNSTGDTRQSECDATLTFYRNSNVWYLGKVELQ